jgi:hypothetical protein
MTHSVIDANAAAPPAGLPGCDRCGKVQSKMFWFDQPGKPGELLCSGCMAAAIAPEVLRVFQRHRTNCFCGICRPSLPLETN